jgi:hypothetical protein
MIQPARKLFITGVKKTSKYVEEPRLVPRFQRTFRYFMPVINAFKFIIHYITYFKNAIDDQSC